MRLRQQLALDAHSVFLNTDEFAELISIEDVPETPAVCDWAAQPGGEHLYGDTGLGRERRPRGNHPGRRRDSAARTGAGTHGQWPRMDGAERRAAKRASQPQTVPERGALNCASGGFA